MDKSRVCTEQTVERLHDKGMTPAETAEEAAEVMGVDEGWNKSIVST